MVPSSSFLALVSDLILAKAWVSPSSGLQSFKFDSSTRILVIKYQKQSVPSLGSFFTLSLVSCKYFLSGLSIGL